MCYAVHSHRSVQWRKAQRNIRRHEEISIPRYAPTCVRSLGNALYLRTLSDSDSKLEARSTSKHRTAHYITYKLPLLTTHIAAAARRPPLPPLPAAFLDLALASMRDARKITTGIRRFRGSDPCLCPAREEWKVLKRIK